MMFCRCMRLAALNANNANFLRNVQTVQKTGAVGYKSKLSLDNLYPNNSTQNYLGVKEIQHTYSSSEDEVYSGYIPLEEVEFTYTRSGGSGGQHVNKVDTKALCKFHIDSATWIPEWIRVQLHVQQKNHISKHGYLLVSSEKTRKQMLNKADCLEQIRSMIYKAAIKPKEPTPEELALIAKRKAKAKAEVLSQKRRHSQKKADRMLPRGEF